MTQPFLPPYSTTADMTPINVVLAVAPNDTTDLPAGNARAFFATAAGNIAFQDTQGNAVAFVVSSTLVGQIIWIRAKRILNTGTTATGIYACY